MGIERFLQPPGWAPPRGYSNGVVASGRTIWLAGQIGWDETGRFAEGLAAQTGQALRNIVALLTEAGAEPGHLVRLTWYIRSAEAYHRELPAIGQAYRQVIGRHFPAMAVVEVVRLVEPDALVEIEATAVL